MSHAGNLHEANCPLVSISSQCTDVLQLGNEARELLDFKKAFDTVLHAPKAIAVEHGKYSLLICGIGLLNIEQISRLYQSLLLMAPSHNNYKSQRDLQKF